MCGKQVVTGKCNPNAVNPATDEKVSCFSAGGYLNPDSAIHSEHAGDSPVLLVMIHEGRDNYAKIPATTDGKKRYHSHLEDVFGPDSLTKATGDAGDRFACGVVVRKAT